MRSALKYIIPIAILLIGGIGGAYFLVERWTHRFDELIEKEATVYRLDPKLVWSLIYEETYFRPDVKGDAGELGLMQITPIVAKMWAKETGLKQFERRTEENIEEFVSDPKRNIQIGCWYLETLVDKYSGSPANLAIALAAYNAGPTRVDDWLKDVKRNDLDEGKFVEMIAINSTKKYVTSILERYRGLKESE
jgi:soluble lytic murein transglycosylase